ncbi:MAG: hypothetical protein P8Z00_13990 [Anaerolineales bacterium]|jgi:hypothetical protein
MLWLKEHHHIFQAIALLLFCAAILGPWGISDDGVPPADWCSEPYITLRADRCVRLMPGIEFLGIGGLLLFTVPFAVLTGGITPLDFVRTLLFIGFFLLLVLPVLSTLITLFFGETRRRRRVNLVLWALAGIPAVLVILSAGSLKVLSLIWGIWVYAGLVAAMFTLSVIRRRSDSNLPDSTVRP